MYQNCSARQHETGGQDRSGSLLSREDTEHGEVFGFNQFVEETTNLVRLDASRRSGGIWSRRTRLLTMKTRGLCTLLLALPRAS